MNSHALLRWATLFALLAAPVAALGDKDQSTDTKTSGTLSDAALQVLAHVHQVDLMEIDMGRVAARSGSTRAVRAYGDMLVKDHEQNDKELMALVKRHDQTIPMEMPTNESERQEMKDNQTAMAHLRTLKGADFDRELLQMAVRGHDRELSRTDAAIAQPQNSGIADFLKTMKPMLQRHLDQAKELQKTNPQASTP